jgi:hypothetical protein
VQLYKEGPEMVPQFQGTACKDVDSINTVLTLYGEHQKGDEEAVRKMVSQTHQCARVLFGHPLYIVYHGKRMWGTNGMAQAFGFALKPDKEPFMYAVMQPDGQLI